ncbi:putative ABC transport system permease protein [Natranaerovirga pectinivora]|uniref:Putative ABC transport system permease protein n=1 Tax=Natranaerovirga pectinivora TaxID=682400 RepID=A0A4R3MGI0_9FIRM|nr:FtsX-like permease family protein [Natranaerovirga pectinivora]TCT12864.1 putative ABC transport system permease protein [Natranaerovirga pectinivora]
MNIVNKLTIRSLKLNKRRTIVTVIGIILSCAMIFGVATITTSFQDLFIQETILSRGNYHSMIGNVPVKDAKYILDNAYTKSGMISRDRGFSPLETSRIESKPYIYVKEYNQEAMDNLTFLREGRYPEKEGEILLSQTIIENGGTDYKIGDTISLEIGHRYLDNAPIDKNNEYTEEEAYIPFAEKTYTITGIIRQDIMEFYTFPGMMAIAYLEESNLEPTETLDIYILGKNPRQIYDKTTEMARTIGLPPGSYGYNSALLRWLGVSDNDNINRMFITLALIIILLVVIGSVAVIYNAFAISISERKKQFGMLSSVGATKSQIRKTVLFEGFILGIIGIPLGILSGILGIGITLKVVNKLMAFEFLEGIELRLIISPLTLITTVVFTTLTIFLSAYLPAKKASKISPIEAIRLTTDIKLKRKKLKTLKITKKLFGIEGELALKNLKRNRKRYRATIFSLSISIVLFIAFSSFMRYGFVSSDMYYGEVPYDIALELRDRPYEEQRAFYDKIIELEKVKRYAIERNIRTFNHHLEPSQLGNHLNNKIEKNTDQKNEEENASLSYVISTNSTEERSTFPKNEKGMYSLSYVISTIGEESFRAYGKELGIDIEGYKDTNTLKGIVINKNITVDEGKMFEFEPLNMNKGDVLTLTKSAMANHTNETINMEIGTLTKELPFGLLYDTGRAVNVIVTEEVFEEILNQLKEEDDNRRSIHRLKIETEDTKELIEEINEIYGQNTEDKLVIVDVQFELEMINRIKTVISIFLYGFVSLITLIGVTNIFNTISTNVILRRREFAMLKSVGLTPKGFNKMIRFESIFYGMKSLLYGLPIAILISVGMHRSTTNFFVFEYIPPIKESIICIIGVFIIVSITMTYSMSKIKKENIIEALKEENL